MVPVFSLFKRITLVTGIVFSVIGPVSAAQPAIVDQPAGAARPSLEHAITESWNVLALRDGMAVSFWDMGIRADGDAVVLIGASSEFVFAAVLSGAARADDDAVMAGEMAFWPIVGGGATVSPFVATRLQANLRSAGRDDLAGLLEPVREKQERLIYWGLLEETGVSVAMPVAPTLEQVRRDYRRRAALIAAHRGGGDAPATSRRVASSFASALRAGDAPAVATHLDPRMFSIDNNPAASPGWMELRERFAREITDDAVAGSAQTIGDTGQPGVYSIDIAGKRHRLTTTLFDGVIFVDALTSED